MLRDHEQSAELMNSKELVQASFSCDGPKSCGGKLVATQVDPKAIAGALAQLTFGWTTGPGVAPQALDLALGGNCIKPDCRKDCCGDPHSPHADECPAAE